MPIIKIDDREFDLDTLPDGAKQNLNMLKLIETGGAGAGDGGDD